jgi:hypothetical protein
VCPASAFPTLTPPALSVAEIAARLVDSLEVLTAGSRTALTRQQTLRATIDWSHFAGTFSLGAAEDVRAGGPIELRHVADLLARLVAKSLVVVDSGRYRLLDTIRQFAAEHLSDAGELEAVDARLLDWAVALATAHDPDTQAGRTAGRSSCSSPTRTTSARRSTAGSATIRRARSSSSHVQQGPLTVWDKTVGNCAPFQVSKGQSFVEPANHVHRAMNEGSQTVKLYAVFLGIPKGAQAQKAAQAPAGCAS